MQMRTPKWRCTIKIGSRMYSALNDAKVVFETALGGSARKASACVAGAVALMAAPAMAEERDNVAAPVQVQASDAQTLQAPADQTALVPTAELPAAGNPLGGAAHDRQFQQLFASWEAIETGKPAAISVAVPAGMPLANARMSSGYGMRNHPVLRRRARHRGIDLAAPTGTPVYATADGVIGRADWFSSYGLYVKIEHGGELETRYAHMSRLAVNAGQRVKKGDIIGYVGSTGRSTGPHLHYEVRVDGQDVDPTPYMKGHDGAVQYANATGAHDHDHSGAHSGVGGAE
jgi:murein DD-endopeptidase MepM/ murein hydrolase activator NlpD